MNDENTIYDAQPQAHTSNQSQSEETQFTQTTSNTGKKDQTKKKSSGWQRAAAGAGMGAVVGAGATILSSSAPADQTSNPGGGGSDNHHDENDVHVWADEEMHVATSVNDDMSFSEAFQAARAEVGAGGAFEWHGQVYNTYTAEEWNSMTAEERAEYGSHFNWSEHHSDYVAEHHSASDDVEVTVSEPTEVNDGYTSGADVAETDVVPVNLVEDESDVQILGVVHDDDSGANIGGMIVDGHDAVLLDIDGDMQFEILGVDVNDNQQLEENELIDVAEAGITVNDLGGFTPMDNTMQASEPTDTTPDIYEC